MLGAKTTRPLVHDYIVQRKELRKEKKKKAQTCFMCKTSCSK
jgi:hypothetical protein